jgi:hypothetical protein
MYPEWCVSVALIVCVSVALIVCVSVALIVCVSVALIVCSLNCLAFKVHAPYYVVICVLIVFHIVS